ncbi:MAG: DNA-protecting protein DprA [Eggerthellaceae bacterium]|nr:DNA-protecting protein DprA [Eggerthellaceae bacterium]
MFDGKRTIIESGDYPQQLQRLDGMPERLYVIGNPDALHVPAIAVIGARRASEHALRACREVVRTAVGSGFAIVSGGARGVDAEAHRAALGLGGRTVAVLAHGLDRCYPPEHRGLFQQMVDAGGCLVSEQAWGVEPRPHLFRQRNRIVTALSLAAVVCECGLPSGTFSAADGALAQGCPVLAVPASGFSGSPQGTNALIAAGAVPVYDGPSLAERLSRL